ncbi:MAG: VWA domain-containing protein [Desulfamplus sp.]|nr:VWA domain-containing protein [Desulfamplus sp.]
MQKRFFAIVLFWLITSLAYVYVFPIISLLPIQGLQYEVEASSLYYILDGSGSMWGRVDGQMKIQAARDTMKNLISKMPDEILYSLTVYGNLKKGDCSDITEIIPFGKIDHAKAIELIRTINPKGKTPIAATIEKTIKNLKAQNSHDKTEVETTTIILISDGIETCGGSPCEITTQLKSSGINFVIHVVGFDVDKEASEQLACIANAGGGRYFSTKNADELLSILSTVQRSVIDKKSISITEKVEQNPINNKEAILSSKTPKVENIVTTPVEQKIIERSKSVRIKAKGPGKITFKHDSWLKKPYSWKLIDPETGEEKAKFSTLETTIIAPGSYQVVWDQYEHESSDVPLTEVIRVDSGKTVEIPLMTAIQLNIPSWVDKPQYWGLRDPQTLENIVMFTKFEPLLVPAGEYDIIWRQGEHSSKEVAIQRVNIVPDIINNITISTSINTIPAEWVDKKIHYWGLKRSEIKDSTNLGFIPTNSNNEDFVAWFSDKFAPQLVPSGKYHLIYDLSEHGSSDSILGEIEVVEGKMNEFKVNTGVKLIPPQGMKPPYLVEFIQLNRDKIDDNKEGKTIEEDNLNNIDEDKLSKVIISGSFGPIALKPGIYKINYRQEEHGASTMTIVDELELEAGNLIEIEL